MSSDAAVPSSSLFSMRTLNSSLDQAQVFSGKGRKHHLGGGGEALGDTHRVDVVAATKVQSVPKAEKRMYRTPPRSANGRATSLVSPKDSQECWSFGVHLIERFFDNACRIDPSCLCSNRSG